MTNQRNAIEKVHLSKIFDKISHYALGNRMEKNEQNASLIRWLKKKISVSGEWITIAWNQFSNDVPESFLFGLALVDALNANFIQKYRTHGHQLCR